MVFTEFSESRHDPEVRYLEIDTFLDVVVKTIPFQIGNAIVVGICNDLLNLLNSVNSFGGNSIEFNRNSHWQEEGCYEACPEKPV